MGLLKWIGRYFNGKHSELPPEQQRTTDSEFTAEVVRIVEVVPHGNADKLEVAHFELKGSGPTVYDVVIQKGSYKCGDLAAYFSVDCILPLSHPDFSFLTSRLDGAGKTHYRLRAARLRGVFSQGLLVNAPAGAQFGDPMAESFGVTYYRAPEPVSTGPTAPTARPRVQPMPEYSVESLKKVPRLFEEGELVVVTEKIHGCNFRCAWVRRKLFGIPFGWKWVVGSHHAIKGDGRGGFYGEDVWIQAAEDYDLKDLLRAHKGFAFYGELYGYTPGGKALQDLTYSVPPKTARLAFFDVKKISGNEWLDASDRFRLLDELGLPSVPIVATDAYGPHMLAWAEGKSVIDGKTQREGVVIEKLTGQRKKAKYVGQGYLTRKETAVAA